jgi:hypothetical protein
MRSGSLGNQRANGGGPGRHGGKGRQRTGPLRKVIREGVGLHPEYPHSFYELLECGHLQLPVEDLMGPTNAYRRRCRKCKRGAPPDCPVSDGPASV